MIVRIVGKDGPEWTYELVMTSGEVGLLAGDIQGELMSGDELECAQEVAQFVEYVVRGQIEDARLAQGELNVAAQEKERDEGAVTREIVIDGTSYPEAHSGWILGLRASTLGEFERFAPLDAETRKELFLAITARNGIVFVSDVDRRGLVERGLVVPAGAKDARGLTMCYVSRMGAAITLRSIFRQSGYRPASLAAAQAAVTAYGL